MSCSLKSPLPPIKPIGYRFRPVNLGHWFMKSSSPPGLTANERPIGKPVTRHVLWTRLLCSSGLIVDIVTPPSFSPRLGEILLLENRPDAHDPEIELARVESTYVAEFGVQLIKYDRPVQHGDQTFRWAVLEGIWSKHGQPLVLGRCARQEDATSAKRTFEEQARFIFKDTMLGAHEPSSREQVAETGKWQALKDVHPKTVRAMDRASAASAQDECEKHMREAADEFGKEFYSLRKQIIWADKRNTTAAVPPLDKVPAGQRKSIGRRKPSPNLPNRYIATCWVLRGLADMSAAELARHVNEHFNTSFTASQIRTIRKRLQLWVDWEGEPPMKSA